MNMDKNSEKKEEIATNLTKEFKEIRKKVNGVRAACGKILDAAEEALKLLKE